MAVKRDDRGRLLPGSVNNPVGRPPSPLALTEIARRKLPAEQLVNIFLRIAQGQPLTSYIDPETKRVVVTDGAPPEGATAVSVVLPTTPEQLRAAEFLWDKIEPPSKNVDLTVKDGRPRGPDFSKMSPEQLDKYVELSRQMLELQRPASPPAGVIDATSVEVEPGKK